MAHWADVDLIADKALAVLRLDDTDVDASRVSDAAPVAVALIDAYLDAEVPYEAPGPPPLESAAVQVTVEVYRRKDAPFGVLNAWAPEDVAVRIGPQALAGVRLQLLPYRMRWGIA